MEARNKRLLMPDKSLPFAGFISLSQIAPNWSPGKISYLERPKIFIAASELLMQEILLA